jgi:uncharacterized protein with NRDE domain
VTERSHLRETIHVRPFPIKLEPESAPNIYGTRLSTVILIRKDGRAVFVERDVWKWVDGKAVEGDPSLDRKFSFQLDIVKGG